MVRFDRDAILASDEAGAWALRCPSGGRPSNASRFPASGWQTSVGSA